MVENNIKGNKSLVPAKTNQLSLSNGYFVAPPLSAPCLDEIPIPGPASLLRCFTNDEFIPSASLKIEKPIETKLYPENGEEFCIGISPDKSYSSRDYLESLIKRRGYLYSRQKNYFVFRDAIRDEIVRLGHILDIDKTNKVNKASQFDEKLAFNFKHCGSLFGVGEFRVGLDENGNNASQSAIYRCGSKYCPDCRDRDRKRVLKKYVDYFYQFLSVSPSYRIQFTLPPEVSKILFETAENGVIQDEEIIQHITKTVRQGFGFKTRSNMPILISRHVIGDKGGFFKNHLHYHVECFPFEVCKDKETGDFFIKNSIYSGYLHINHISFFCDMFSMYLSEKFNFEKINRPQFSYMSKISADADEQESEIKKARTAHHVLYDSRSFVADLRKSFPLAEKTGAYFQQSDFVDGENYQKYVFRDYKNIAGRMLFVFQNSRYYPYGILTNMKRLESLFKYYEEETYLFEITHHETASISRRFNARSGVKNNKNKVDEYITLKDSGRPILVDQNMSTFISFANTIKKFGIVSIFEFYKRRFVFDDLQYVLDNKMYMYNHGLKKEYIVDITKQERALFRKFLGKSISFSISKNK